MSMESVNVNIGLLGCGTVGASLCKLIDEQSEAIAERTGLTLDVALVWMLLLKLWEGSIHLKN